MMKENSVRLLSKKAWTEVKYSNKKENMSKKGQRQELGGRKILFSRKEAQSKMSEEDSILSLNKTFQKVGESISIYFTQVSNF